jgi:hypothetical protein
MIFIENYLQWRSAFIMLLLSTIVSWNVPLLLWLFNAQTAHLFVLNLLNLKLVAISHLQKLEKLHTSFPAVFLQYRALFSC